MGTWSYLSDGETPYYSPRDLPGVKSLTKTQVDSAADKVAKRPKPEPIITGDQEGS